MKATPVNAYPPAQTIEILTLQITNEHDIIAVRARTRQIALTCGFGALDQARIGTVASELARNIFNYARVGSVRFAIEGPMAPQLLSIKFEDAGPGIEDIDHILSGNYRSKTGMGLGILSAKRLMERFHLKSDGTGTQVYVGKLFPANAPFLHADAVAAATKQFDPLPGEAALHEARNQNRELSDALSALQVRQDELQIVTTRLENKNRDVEQLNALLDVKAVALQQADRSKDEFLAMLGHELRGPLSATSMAATLLQPLDVSAERANRMGALISRQVAHMSKLVEDLLDVSRVSRGLVQFDMGPVDLADVISASIEQVKSAADEKLHVIEELPGPAAVFVFGDRTRLIQVLSNLLSNAIRYTEKGGLIKLTSGARGSMGLLRVSDNGIGIAEELMPRLFDLYVQAEISPDRTGGGLGLGLALVKSLVESHGGTVTAHSAGEGMGSIFTVLLPLFTPAQMPVAE